MFISEDDSEVNYLLPALLLAQSKLRSIIRSSLQVSFNSSFPFQINKFTIKVYLNTHTHTLLTRNGVQQGFCQVNGKQWVLFNIVEKTPSLC